MNDGNSCGCFVAHHPRAAEIDVALRSGEDPRALAARFSIGKSRLYEHRRHLGAAPAADATTPPGRSPPGVPVLSEPAQPPEPSVERFHGTVESRVESGGTIVPRVPGPARALPTATPSGGLRTGYIQAIEENLGLITEGRWRAAHVKDIAEKCGLSVDRGRHAYHEATRHLQLNMGGYLQKQATSAAWTVRQRDEARARAESATAHAERWRRQEQEAQEAADKLAGKERMAALDTAARFGLLATKYDLSAEKWSAQALAHQRHLDDVLCLRSPKEVSATQINIGGDGLVLFERFGVLLAARFKGQPDVLAELAAAAAEAKRGWPGDEAAIDAIGEAA